MLDCIKNLKKHPKRRAQPQGHPFRNGFGKHKSTPSDIAIYERVLFDTINYNFKRKKLIKTAHKFPGKER